MKVKLTVDSTLGLAGKIVDIKCPAECRMAVLDGLAKELPPEPNKPASAKKATQKATATATAKKK